jgi:predicted metal-dependent phosphoesterase TrpH
MEKCDLHVHSTFSDGTYTPEELIAAAISEGISTLALCDHNTVDGIPDFLRAAEGKPIRAIAGAEFSVDYAGKEVHLLGLGLSMHSFDRIGARMRAADARKEESNLSMIASLARVGILLDYEQMKQRTPKGRINRANFAAQMVERGYVSSREEAFARYLSPHGAHYVPPVRIGLWEMLDELCAMGAVPVLAHPLLNFDEEALRVLLREAGRRGLVGMECLYSTYTERETELSLSLAAEYGLLPSGGSDFHGANKPDIHIGTGRGNLSVPNEWATALLERCE